MTTLTLLLSLLVVDALSILSPGPNILMVTQVAAERSRRQALCVAAGMAAAGVTWAALALTGLAALFELLPSLQTAIRIAGAAYLIWIGFRLLRSTIAKPQAATTAAAPIPGSALRGFLQGFATSLLNPKAAAYFGSIFVLFVPHTAPLWVKLAAVGIVGGNAVLCYGTVALLFSTDRVKAGYLALRRPIDRLCGLLMVGFGGRLIAG
jgi:threonine/homoserine/homoserine lactone efflux protein